MHSPAAERNKGPIAEVLGRVLPATGLVLEIAGGSGQHVVHFARALPQLQWQPSEADPALLEAMTARVQRAALANLRAPLALDVCARPWPVREAEAIVCLNLLHIAPWPVTEALLDGAAAVLGAGALLYVYGPFRRAGRHTAPSNAAFDADLRARDPRWGVRDLEAVEAAARGAGLDLAQILAMPANNLSLVFTRAA